MGVEGKERKVPILASPALPRGLWKSRLEPVPSISFRRLTKELCVVQVEGGNLNPVVWKPVGAKADVRIVLLAEHSRACICLMVLHFLSPPISANPHPSSAHCHRPHLPPVHFLDCAANSLLLCSLPASHPLSASYLECSLLG